LEHYKEYDFIWSSPPCQTHSGCNIFLNAQGVIRYPDMMLWQEIIFLRQFVKCKWVVENVISYYEPLIKPFKSNSHYYWGNFIILQKKDIIRNIIKANDRECKTTKDGIMFMEKEFNINLSKFNLTLSFKEKILNNFFLCHN